MEVIFDFRKFGGKTNKRLLSKKNQAASLRPTLSCALPLVLEISADSSHHPSSDTVFCAIDLLVFEE